VIAPVGSVGKPAPSRRRRASNSRTPACPSACGQAEGLSKVAVGSSGTGSFERRRRSRWTSREPFPCCPQRPSGAALSTAPASTRPSDHANEIRIHPGVGSGLLRAGHVPDTGYLAAATMRGRPAPQRRWTLPRWRSRPRSLPPTSAVAGRTGAPRVHRSCAPAESASAGSVLSY
jgi:hypothetical protein